MAGRKNLRTKRSFADQRDEVALPPGLESLVNIKQTMAALNFRARSSIYLLVKQGHLHPVKILGSTRFRVEEIRRLQRGEA